MKTLIEIDSPLYLKRVVRELNQQEHGFYASVAAHSVRCNRARLANGVIEVRSPSCSPMWFAPSNNSFVDTYSREIVATRHAN